MDFSLSDDTRAFLADVRTWSETRVAPEAADIDHSAAYPRALIRDAARLGLCAVAIDPSHGGAGRDAVSYTLAIEVVAGASATVAVTLVVTNSLVGEPIARHGTPTQQSRWLHAIASGEIVGAFALSEEHAGSDAANQQTTATADGDEFILTGRKVWVANAEAASVAIVFAVTDPAAKRRGISAFLVPLDAPGVTRTPCDSLGVRGLGCMDIDLAGVRVGREAMLGTPGAGLGIAHDALERGRVAIAAQALGVGEAALDLALAYAREREAFGQPIGHFQAIQFQLADLATDLEAARLLTWRAADAISRGASAGVEASMAKLQASEAAHRAADRAMQILASAGYRRGSRIERLFRDARAAEIYQGTSEVQRLVISEGLLGPAARSL